MRRRPYDTIGLFPAIGPAVTGGVEAAGRVAWDCVSRESKIGAYLISYSPGQKTEQDGSGYRCGRQAEAAIHALRVASRDRCVLVWHLGLSPLLPIVRPARGRSAVFLHGVEAWRRLNPLQRLALELSRPHLLANTDETRSRFLSANPWARCLTSTVVPLGLGDPVEVRPTPAPVPSAVMVGRLLRSESYKGHHEVISAWPAVLREVPGAQLWIVGDGDLRPDLEAHARALGLTDHVLFFGWLTDAERDERIASARCLALPSRGEGFGLVYIEAMRFGRPCLVSTQDAGREVVAPPTAGLEVDPVNIPAVASALVRLLSNTDEWRAWSDRARDRYESLYTEAAFRQRLTAEWQKVRD